MAKQHKFGKRSLERLDTVDPRLAHVIRETLPVVPFDLTVLCGHRTKEQQDEAVRKGMSNATYPASKHNSLPSTAVDVAPLVNGEIPWDDLRYFAWMHGAILAVAGKLGVKVRSGLNWDGDAEIITDQNLVDGPHVELAD